MKRRHTIALLGALAAMVLSGPVAQSAPRLVVGKPVVKTAKPAPKLAQYDPRKRRFFPRRGVRPPAFLRAPGGHRGLMSKSQTVRMALSRMPGRIISAKLHGRIASFRILSRRGVFTVIVDRLLRRAFVRRGLS